MVAPEFIYEGDYWDNIDDADGYASGKFGDNEPGVTIPELLDEHKNAIIGTAIGAIGLIAAKVIVKRVKGRKDKE